MAAFLLISFSALLSKKHEAKWQYYAWLVIVIGFIIPFSSNLDFTFFKIDVLVVQPQDVSNIFVDRDGKVSELLEASTITISCVVCYVWLAGMLLVYWLPYFTSSLLHEADKPLEMNKSYLTCRC